MYREIQSTQRRMNDLEERLRSAILATNTRDMGTYSGDAHAIAEDVKYELDHMLNEGVEGTKGEERFVQASLDSMRNAILSAQKSALGTSVDELRASLLDFKTHVDFADAYIHAALGYEME